MNRLLILLESIQIVKNWYILPLVYFKIYKKKYYILKLKNGKKIKLRNNSTDIHTFTNIWIIEEYSQIGNKKKEIIIDIGAHIGLFSIYALKCDPKEIIAFEPIKENYDLLKENVLLNKIENIKCYNVAVSDEKLEVEIYFNQDFAAHSLIKKEGHSRKVKSMSLKNIFDKNEISECDILKLDCEGSEYTIFETLPDIYYNKIKKIIMEYHIFDSNYKYLEKLKNKLEKMNFILKINPTNENMGMLYTETEQSKK